MEKMWIVTYNSDCTEQSYVAPGAFDLEIIFFYKIFTWAKTWNQVSRGRWVEDEVGPDRS